MRKMYIFSPLAIAAGAFLWMSASGGVAKIQHKDRTGSPVTSQDCKACHSGGSFSTVGTFTLSDSTGPVTEYTPGGTYSLTIGIQSTGNSGNGFQAVALLDDNSAAGTSTSVTSKTQVTSLNSRDYFEHSGIATGGAYEMTWVAPVQGSGDVTFYGSALSVNGDGSTSGDEYVDIPDLIITEGAPSGINDNAIAHNLKVYPNPAVNEVYLDVESQNITHIEVYSITGSLAFQSKVNNSRYLMDISSFDKGAYMVKVFTQSDVYTSRFIKK